MNLRHGTLGPKTDEYHLQHEPKTNIYSLAYI